MAAIENFMINEWTNAFFFKKKKKKKRERMKAKRYRKK
jgi:hypothetical protein